MGTKKSEFENFDKVMDGLLSVPYSEIQKKLEEEKKTKAETKKKQETLNRKSK